MRVFPLFTVGAIIVRAVPPKPHVVPGAGVHCGGTNRGLNTWLKSYGVAEPSSAGERRQTPWSNADAYTVFASSGSRATSITPNEHGGGTVAEQVGSLPFQTSVNVLPPFVDS